jgi:transposase InsO family protein
MGMARYVVDAVVLEGRSVRDVARAHGLSKTWIYELLGRYRAGGYEALEARSRRPRSCPHETPAELVQEVLRLRRELQDAGHDCGPATIRYHLATRRKDVPCRATIWRILKRQGLIVPQPQKRPLCSRIRFEADLPNEMWQADITAWQLADGQPAEILNLIDDHSRLLLGSDAYTRVKAADVVASFHKAAQLHGLPYSLLSDNGAVFTGASRRGKVLLESELERLRVLFKNSRPYHPQTCGKVERLHQTLKRYLAKQTPPATLTELQAQLDAFAHYYNDIRPHRALGGQTPLQAYSARVKAKPANATTTTYFRVREDKVDKTGRVTLRYDSRLYHIGLGRAHKGRAVKLLVADRDIRIIDLQGQLIRELTLDPNRDYQPLKPA